MADGSGQGTIETTALIVAAGSGERLGAGGPKALVEVAGRPLYRWSLDACRRSTRIGPIVIAVPPGRSGEFADEDVIPVDGGRVRSESVAAGLAEVRTEFVLVHDAARPLVTPDLIDRVIFALEIEPDVDAVIAAAPVTDTVKRVDAEGVVSATLDRAELRSIQTPQVFRTEALRRAIEGGDLENATDDAFLIESAGGRVSVFDAPPTNIKVTVAADVAMAEFLLAHSPDAP
ncbi:MAG TPA: 2-C-methyl-D-erythritol 4-phosphate cytidylyltransferase [Solirubrobacterales bacterium]|nr:2-C-methyl-D-erythritol 4-phosphate cytidylyltransferase [Solirubrobacterales bacterium]